MASFLKVSEAASLALHTVVYLATYSDHPVAVKDIAASLCVSEAHLAKVLQRLAKVGLVQSNRGPKGGFVLGRDAEKMNLLEVYEAIEGPLQSKDCLFDIPMCNDGACIMGDLLGRINQQVREYLVETKVSQLIHAYRRLEVNA